MVSRFVASNCPDHGAPGPAGTPEVQALVPTANSVAPVVVTGPAVTVVPVKLLEVCWSTPVMLPEYSSHSIPPVLPLSAEKVAVTVAGLLFPIAFDLYQMSMAPPEVAQ